MKLVSRCVVLVASLAAIVGGTMTSAAALTNVDVMFNETSDSDMYGVHATWDQPFLNQSIHCPNANGNADWIHFRVQARDGSKYIELGARYVHYNFNGACDTQYYYYFQWNTNGNTHEVTGLNPTAATHDFAINQLSGDWQGRVDGGSSFDASGLVDSTNMASASKVRVGGECHQDAGSSNDCLSTAEESPQNGLTYKPDPATSGSWHNWTNQDSNCVDYNHGAVGKWNTDTGVHDGFNVTISGSDTGPSC